MNFRFSIRCAGTELLNMPLLVWGKKKCWMFTVTTTQLGLTARALSINSMSLNFCMGFRTSMMLYACLPHWLPRPMLLETLIYRTSTVPVSAMFTNNFSVIEMVSLPIWPESMNNIEILFKYTTQLSLTTNTTNAWTNGLLRLILNQLSASN